MNPLSTLSVLSFASAVLAPPALAQFGGSFTPPEVSNPVLEVWLFESPVVPAVVLLVLGGCAAMILNRRSKGRPALITLGVVVALAVGMFVSAATVTTDRERITKKIHQIITAIAEPETDAARGLMRSTVSLRMKFGASSEGRESLLSQVDRLHQEATVRSARVAEVRCKVRSNTLAVAYVRVKVEGSVSGFPIPPTSWWEMHYARSSDPGSPWELAAIEPLWILGVENPAGR